MPRDTNTATCWGICVECGYPGLAPARKFERTPQPRCGFCGGDLRPTDADLTGLANRIIAEPLHRETHRGRAK